MASFYKKGKTFVVVFRLKGFRREYIYGISNEKLAKRIKQRKDEEEQLSRAGLIHADPYEEQLRIGRATSIFEHISCFGKSIRDRGKSRQYARQQESLVRRVFLKVKIADLDGIRTDSIQSALMRMREDGRGARTVNSARQALIQFERYLHRNGAIRRTVLQALERFNEQQDIRRARRALSQEEIDWLLTTLEATKGESSRCGINAIDRAMLYAIALATGFRQRALLSLEKCSFQLDCPHPFVRLSAKWNKNGKNRDQIIPVELAARLRNWLVDKPGAGRIWRPLPHARLGLRFRRDLDLARSAWISASKDDRERNRRKSSRTLMYVYSDGIRNVFADFHSLRHTAITFVVRSAGLRIAQKWADHSTPNLTSKYASVDEDDLCLAVNGLPTLNANRLEDLKESAKSFKPERVEEKERQR